MRVGLLFLALTAHTTHALILGLQPPRARPHRAAVVAAAEGHGKRQAARGLFAAAAAAVTLGGTPFVPAAHAAPATAQLTRPAIARSIVPGTGRVAKARRRKSDVYDIDVRGAVTDAAGMLGDGGYAAQIKSAVRAIERDVDGSAVRVVTVDDVDADSPKAFATRLFNRLALGSERTENGVLVLVVKDQRRVEVEVGVGLNRRMSSSWCSGMLQDVAIPEFKEGRYGKGVAAAVERIGERLRGGDDAPASSGGVGGLELAGYGILLAATPLMNAAAERQRRKCPSCGEVVDSSASYAEDGTLRSGCAPWATTTPATNVASGERRRDYACGACGATGTFVDTIPKYDSVRYRRDGSPVYYNKPSSSSNSGGSSSGGGGGASW